MVITFDWFWWDLALQTRRNAKNFEFWKSNTAATAVLEKILKSRQLSNCLTDIHKIWSDDAQLYSLLTRPLRFSNFFNLTWRPVTILQDRLKSWDIYATVWPLSMKFGMLTQIGAAILEKVHYLSSATVWLVSVKLFETPTRRTPFSTLDDGVRSYFGGWQL